jgi:hypothetical protein
VEFLKEDKVRALKILLYLLYTWLIKYKLLRLMTAHFKTIFRMRQIKMAKIVSNTFIVMLIAELAFEEVGKIRQIAKFLKYISSRKRIRSIASGE